MSRFSLRVRLLLGVVLLGLLGLVAADIATYRALRSFLVDQVDTTLQQEHQAFEGGPGGDEGHTPPGVYSEMRAADGRTVLTRLTVGVFRGQATPPAPLLPETINVPAQPNEGPDRVSYFTVGSRGSGEEYRVRAAVEPALGGTMLVVADSLHGVDSTLH